MARRTPGRLGRRGRPARGWSLLTALVLVAALCSTAQAAKPGRPMRVYADTVTVQVPTTGPYAVWRQVPQAWWLSTAVSTKRVRGAVSAYLGRAAKAKARPVIVLYAIPDRDCGSYSAGGFRDSASYRSWIAQVARGLRGSSAMVVLEPDALASATTCGGTARLSLLKWATKRLARTGAWVYLDAGHSSWEKPEVMVSRLKSSGIRWARGISLNVSNYRSTTAERRFGLTLIKGLRRSGISGKHVVIDTSRNGATPQSTEWCNPTWARVGARPRLFRSGMVDGYLWIKHPGESDGTCNGGPAAGQWSDLLAARLTAR